MENTDDRKNVNTAKNIDIMENMNNTNNIDNMKNNGYAPLGVRSLVLGDGVPKICIPVTAVNREELACQIERILESPFDMVEWRADFYEETEREQWVEETLALLRRMLGDKALLFTFRTREEGGERSISMEEYCALNEAAAASGLADLIDVELNRGQELLKGLVEAAHKSGCRVIASFHDFNGTPETETLTGILCTMQALGADVTKAAVMPKCERDVMTLLEASLTMKEQLASRPFITMSMGAMGGISRLCGALTGSSLTFATAGKSSAPGQMDAALVADVLHCLSSNN